MNKLWIIALALVIFACNKDNNTINDAVECAPIEGSVAIIMNESGSDKSEYCYYEDGKIHFIATYSSNHRLGIGQQGITEYFYDSLGNVDRIESFIPGIIYMSSLNAFDHEVVREYSYQDGKVSEIKEVADYRLTDGTLFVQYLSYDYNEQGQVIKETYENESNVNGQPEIKITGYKEFIYNDIGELESEKYYSNQDTIYALTSIKRFTFDTYQNPLILRPERSFENNILDIEVMSYFDGDSSTYIISYYYDYNEDGLPISKEIFYNMEYSDTEYFVYFNDENDE